MTVRNIKKSLAGVEDIAIGIGALQQERGIVHRVNVFPSSYSYIDMQQYEGMPRSPKRTSSTCTARQVRK